MTAEITLTACVSEKVKNKAVEKKDDRNERELAKHLLDDYYQYTRPVRNYSSVLNVTVQPQIYNLVEVVSF